MAKKFFYVCAGLCLLGLTFHLGAVTAAGQGARHLVVGRADNPSGVDDSGTIWVTLTPEADAV